MPHGAVCAIAADDKGSAERGWLAPVLHRDTHTVVLLLRRHEGGLVLNASAFTLQLLDEQALSHILRHHRNEWIRALLRGEPHVSKRASMCHYCDRRDTVGRFEERSDDSRHVEDFKRARKDGERLRMDRL